MTESVSTWPCGWCKRPTISHAPTRIEGHYIVTDFVPLCSEACAAARQQWWQMRRPYIGEGI
jgi:hypothetical protein